MDLLHLELAQAFLNVVIDLLRPVVRLTGKDDGAGGPGKSQSDPPLAGCIGPGRVDEVHPHFHRGLHHGHGLFLAHPLNGD
jgi:hypothetical protein